MVMIIDDDAEMRAMLRDFLMSEGFRVREAPTGDLVIDSLESEEPAAVVLDKEMPGVNGLDILAYVQHRRPSIPVILITAFGGPEVRAEALAAAPRSISRSPFAWGRSSPRSAGGRGRRRAAARRERVMRRPRR